MTFSRSEKLLLFVLATIQFNHIIDFMIVMPLGPTLMRNFQISPAQFGILVSSYTFAAAASGLMSSFFLDRFDRKKTLLFFFLGFSIGTIACALSEDYSGFLLARTVTGLFGGVLNSIVLSIVGDVFPHEKRGTATGVVMGAFSVASVVGVPFSLILATQFNWHAPFVFLGSLSLVLTALVQKAVPSMVQHLKTPAENPFLVLKDYVTQRNYLIPLVFMFVLVMGQFSVIPFLSPSVVANAGLKESQLPLIYLFGGACSFFASPGVGYLADRYGKHLLFKIFASFSLIPLLFITHMGPSSVSWILFISCLFFIAMSGRVVPSMAMITGAVPAKRRGSFMSLVSSTQNLAAAVASFAAGQIVVTDSSGRLLHYQNAGYLACLFTILGIWLSTKLQSRVS